MFFTFGVQFAKVVNKEKFGSEFINAVWFDCNKSSDGTNFEQAKAECQKRLQQFIDRFSKENPDSDYEKRIMNNLLSGLEALEESSATERTQLSGIQRI